MEYFVLNNGVKIPAIGFGTGIAKGFSIHPTYAIKRIIKEIAKNLFIPGFKENNKYPVYKDIKKDMTLKRVSLDAYREGYRLFDTARAYVYSEEYLGEALFSHGKIDRDSVFLISKISNTTQRNHTISEDFELTLKNLKTDYLDLLLMHWPQPMEYLNTWKVMEKLYKDKKVRAIGVCNCHIHHLEEIKKVAEIPVMVNEIECHPMFQQKPDRMYCKENGIQVIAYTPTGKMNSTILNNEAIVGIKKKYNLDSVSQIILRWHYQLGNVSIPNTTNLVHMRENFNIWNFELTDSEMKEISKMDIGYKIWPDSNNCDYNKL